MEALQGGGDLCEIAAKSVREVSRATRRHPRARTGHGSTGPPAAMALATRLLCALPAEVERQMAAAGVAGWRLAVPRTFQAAVYPGSQARPASYCRHVDGNPTNRRKLTAILYLNERWDADSYGGCLRAYLPGGGGAYTDIEPRGGRLLLFDSTAVEHEVLPTFRTRMALTLWAVRREEG